MMSSELTPKTRLDWTIRRLLQVTSEWFERKSIGSARLDAEVLLAHVLGVDRLRLYIDMERPLMAQELSSYRELVRRRGHHEPVADLVGQKEFYGRPFIVNSEVLIPRPDSEVLIEKALSLFEGDAIRAIDVGTGSGCLGITLACERPKWEVYATDISLKALEVAKRNAANHGLADRWTSFHGDLLSPVSHLHPMDLVISNPPYIRSEDMDSLALDVKDYEPSQALLGLETDGLGHHRTLLEEALGFLRGGGYLLLEIGWDQKKAIEEMNHGGWTAPQFLTDYGGHTRAALWQRKE